MNLVKFLGAPFFDRIPPYDCFCLTEKTCNAKQNTSVLSYLKEGNCSQDKFSRFSRIFTKFAKLNPCEKSFGSQFAKLNLPDKFFFSFFTYIFTLGSLSINNGHVKNILQDIKQYKYRQHGKKNVNLFIISAPFDLPLGIQSKIKYPNNDI